MEINNEKELMKYFEKENISTFQTKNISEHLKKELRIPKIKTKIWISILKTNGLIVRKSVSGNCTTTCASCYEYGCDAGQKSPINFWEIKKQNTILN